MFDYTKDACIEFGMTLETKRSTRKRRRNGWSQDWRLACTVASKKQA